MLLDTASVGLRLGMFFMLGLVHIRDQLPFSVDSDHRLRQFRF